MRKLLLPILMLCSCGIKTDQERASAFIKTEKHPIIVKEAKAHYVDGNKDITLLSKSGGVLYIENTNICLPDTIK